MLVYNSYLMPNPIYTLNIYDFIGLVGRVFANDPGDLGSIPVSVIPKTLKKKKEGTWYLLA